MSDPAVEPVPAPEGDDLGFFVPLVWIVGAMLPPKGMSHVDEIYARRDEAS